MTGDLPANGRFWFTGTTVMLQWLATDSGFDQVDVLTCVAALTHELHLNEDDWQALDDTTVDGKPVWVFRVVVVDSLRAPSIAWLASERERVKEALRAVEEVRA